MEIGTLMRAALGNLAAEFAVLNPRRERHMLRAGDRVTIKIQAGLCRRREPDGGLDYEPRFSGTCDAGTEGVYLGKHLTLPGWHVVRVGDYVAPLHTVHFEPIGAIPLPPPVE